MEVRKVIDCRWFAQAPEDCSLQISGREAEVLECAVTHAVASHGHDDTPELREQLRSMLKDEKATTSV